MNTEQITLLVIDDNPNFLKTITAYVKENSSQELEVVGEADNIQHALSLLRDNHPQAVLLDLKMPDMHGFDAIPLLREIDPKIIIITTTLISLDLYEQTADVYLQSSQAAGADVFLPKALLTRKLVPTLKDQLEKRSRQDSFRD